MIELVCRTIITMPSNSPSTNQHDNANDNKNTNNEKNDSENDTHNSTQMEKLWEKRMRKINFDLEYLWNQVDIQDGSGGGRLYSYSVIIDYLKDMFHMYNATAYPNKAHHALGRRRKRIRCNDDDGNDNDNNNDVASLVRKWKQLSHGLEKLHLLLKDPKSTILILPKHRTRMSDDSSDHDDSDADSDVPLEVPNKSNSSSKSSVSSSTRNMKLKLQPYVKEYERIQMKLLIQQCLQYIRNDYLLRVLSDDSSDDEITDDIIQIDPKYVETFQYVRLQ